MANEMAIIPAASLVAPVRLNKTSRVLAIREAKTYQADYVPHLSTDDVRRMAELAAQHRRNGERDSLLVLTLFDGCFRVSEAISIRPGDIKEAGAGWIVSILGKGHKRGTAAISSGLAAKLQAYAYRRELASTERLFPISRSRAFQIVQALMAAAGITKPDGVGACHVLRHSGALARLKQTGNPKAVQEQLRHSTAQMTLRYMKTLSHAEALDVQAGVNYNW